MRVPLGWMRAYCDPGTSAREIAERLDMTGTEVERIEHAGVGSTDGFVVGRVLKAERHPDADRLTVCEVDDGSGEPRTIVCGAPNVASGQTVAVALPGAVMPDGTRLGEAKLRGVRSSGMILAEDEVGIGEDHAGIMVLPDGLAAGAPLGEHLPIADEVLELEITPNRPDCLAVYGVAREVHAATGAELAEDPTASDAEPSGSDRAEDHATVEIADPDVCLRFTARVFEDVRIGPSPQWLKQRLTAAGQRPISNVVDITNYVMLACGQPLHAFDLDKVRGSRIVVRRAADGERMVTLDDVERTFGPEVALVCDAEGPSGIAGIMGGQISEVSGETTRVLMEAATWVGPNILRSSKALGLRTEASARFEKQLHPEQAMAAQRLAAKLMVELCGARMVPGTLDAYPHARRAAHGAAPPARVERLLGKAIDSGEVAQILGRLGFETTAAGDDAIDAVVPSWRDMDVQREADLIEEVARIYGLDRLPTTLPARRRAVGRLTPAQRLRRRLEDALRDRGLDEAVGWSFTSPEALERLRLGRHAGPALANPLSEDHSRDAPAAAARTARRGAPQHRPRRRRARPVRVGPRVPARRGARGAARQPPRARPRRASATTSARSSPRRRPPRGGAGRCRRTSSRPRALVEALLGVAGLELEASPRPRPFLHPGRCAAVLVGGAGAVGWIGELHPLVAGAWDLEGGGRLRARRRRARPRRRRRWPPSRT